MMTNRKYTIGKLIRLRRQQLGISQKQLAEAVGVSDSAISLYEADSVAQIRDDLIEKMASALDLSVDDLLHPGAVIQQVASETSAGFVEGVRAQHDAALRAASKRTASALLDACLEQKLSVDDLAVLENLIQTLTAKR